MPFRLIIVSRALCAACVSLAALALPASAQLRPVPPDTPVLLPVPPPTSPTSSPLAPAPVVAFPAPLPQTAPTSSALVSPPPSTIGGVAIEVPDDYRLDTDDTISIDVYRHGDVSRTVRIPADGRVHLPRLLSPLLVRGKTCAELSDEIRSRLIAEPKFVVRPGQVAVSVVGMRTRRVFVRGNAVTGREFDLKNDWRVSELVAELGGVPQPDRLTARIVNPSRPSPVTLNLAEALSHPASTENVPLKEGDTLIVQLPLAKRLVITGEGPLTILGTKEVDERYGLRQTLHGLGYSTVGVTSDIHHAKLRRRTIAGDPNAPETTQIVDLDTLLNKPDTPEVMFGDLDTLEIPKSDKMIYVFGEAGGPKRYYLPEDRKTYLADVMATAGGTSGVAKIGDIKVRHLQTDGSYKEQSYNWGKFLKNNDQKQNPEILAQDIVVVPNVKRTDPYAISNAAFTSFGLYNILRTFIPGIK